MMDDVMLDRKDTPLVTIFGGAGYIGSVLTRLLLNNGFRVRVFDNFLFGDEGISGLDHPSLEIIEGDINDTGAASFAVSGAEAIVLLAAIPGRRIVEFEHRAMRDTNLLASSVVLDAAVEHGVNRFIFASTDTVYGVPHGVIYETTVPEPVSLYARLKLRMEERVINKKYRKFHTTALRIGTCHGLSPRMRFDLLPNAMMRDAIVNRKIEIQSGEQWRAFIHVDDAARAIMTCLNAHVNLISGEIFNVSDKHQCISLNQLANMVRMLVPECQIVLQAAEPDLTNYRLSSAKIEKILDFTPRHSLEDSLLQMRDAIRSGCYGDTFSLKYHDY